MEGSIMDWVARATAERQRRGAAVLSGHSDGSIMPNPLEQLFPPHQGGFAGAAAPPRLPGNFAQRPPVSLPDWFAARGALQLRGLNPDANMNYANRSDDALADLAMGRNPPAGLPYPDLSEPRPDPPGPSFNETMRRFQPSVRARVHRDTLLLENDVIRQHPNVRAIFETVPHFEGTETHGFNTRYGGGRFDDLSTFPAYPANTPSTASGRYQILRPEWERIGRDRLGLTDFSPRTQELIGVELLKEHQALDPVLRGDIGRAIPRAATIWASFPMGIGPLEHSYYTYASGPRRGQHQPSARFADVVHTFQQNQARFGEAAGMGTRR